MDMSSRPVPTTILNPILYFLGLEALQGHLKLLNFILKGLFTCKNENFIVNSTESGDI